MAGASSTRSPASVSRVAAADAHDSEYRSINSHSILLVASGSLLLLMLAGSLYTAGTLSDVEARHDAIRSEYVGRAEVLNQARTNVYLTGTLVRDYLLETSAESAQLSRSQLAHLYSKTIELLSTSDALFDYDRADWQAMRSDLDRWWRIIEPTLGWDARIRHQNGYRFLQTAVIPRRIELTSLAERIAALNDRQLRQADSQSQSLLTSLRTKLVFFPGTSLALGLVIAVLCARRVRAVERIAASQLAELITNRDRLQELTALRASLQEQERRNVVRELHDEIGQGLSAVLICIQNLKTGMPTNSPEACRSDFALIQNIAEQAIGVVRHISMLLRPPMLDELGIVCALEWQARELSRVHGLSVTVSAGDLPDDLRSVLGDEQRTCAYRAVEEILFDAARSHAATHASIHLSSTGKSLLINLQHDGHTFGREHAVRLIGVRERIARAGGRMELEHAVDTGVAFAFELPFASECEGEHPNECGGSVRSELARPMTGNTP